MLRLLKSCCPWAIGKAGQALHLGGEGAVGRLRRSIGLHQTGGTMAFF